MLQYYKGQNAVEKGFRFLKDKSFRVAEVYLKKEERIEALSMIMALSLLIYSIAEWMIRQKLKESGRDCVESARKAHAASHFKMDIPEVQEYKRGHYRIQGCNSARGY